MGKLTNLRIFSAMQLKQVSKTRPRGEKTFFKLNSTKYEISTAHKTEILTNEEVSCLKTLRCCIYPAYKC